MGTNYYFVFNKDSNNLSKILDTIFIGPIRDLYYEDIKNVLEKEIHICKFSYGNKALFQKNEFYSSLKQIKLFYEKYKNCLMIIDEYGMEMSFEDLLKYAENKNLDKKQLDQNHKGCYLDDENYWFCDSDFF